MVVPISRRWSEPFQADLSTFLLQQRRANKVRTASITKGLTMPRLEAVRIGSGKRMTAAVLFFDLEDFTSITSAMSNENTLNLLNLIIPTSMMIIKRYRGTVEKNTGDGLMAIFGTETRNEELIARDVIECAMSISSAMDNYIYPILVKEGLPLIGYRMGIDMGNLIVSRIGVPFDSFLVAVGSVANRASKLQSFAETNGICIGENLYRNIHPILQEYCEAQENDEWQWFIENYSGKFYYPYHIFSGRWQQ